MSDSYQAVYDATRSRISNIDSSVVEQAAANAFDISHAKALLQQEIMNVGQMMARPSAIYRPEVSLDGDHYCLLFGVNLMEGVAGFGRTMEEAALDFDKNWFSQKAPSPEGTDSE